MSAILEKLPGIPLPLKEISKQMREMWKGETESRSAAPSEFRASQLNLIVHLGSETTVEEAESVFARAIEFTQRYPGRIIVLCPTENAEAEYHLSGKLFTQCYIGESQREMCCCEALLLQYHPDKPHYLFNQVSIWLESDLPVYHWLHRVPLKDVKNKYLVFVKNSKRVIYDSAIESENFDDIPTPESWRIKDLTAARILPYRQSIGQVLSTFDPKDILNGLQKVVIRFSGAQEPNAKQLCKWMTSCLKMAAEQVEDTEIAEVICEQAKDDLPLSVEFEYQDDQSFHWKLSNCEGCAEVKSKIAGREGFHETTFSGPENYTILSETVFFGN